MYIVQDLIEFNGFIRLKGTPKFCLQNFKTTVFED